MSNIVDFLEKLGGDASVREASREEIDRKLAEVQMEPALRAALASGDREELERLLGARNNLIGFIHPWCCLVAPAIGEEGDEDVQKTQECEDEGPEEQPAPVCDPVKVASAA